MFVTAVRITRILRKYCNSYEICDVTTSLQITDYII